MDRRFSPLTITRSLNDRGLRSVPSIPRGATHRRAAPTINWEDVNADCTCPLEVEKCVRHCGSSPRQDGHRGSPVDGVQERRCHAAAFYSVHCESPAAGGVTELDQCNAAVRRGAITLSRSQFGAYQLRARLRLGSGRGRQQVRSQSVSSAEGPSEGLSRTQQVELTVKTSAVPRGTELTNT